MSYLRYLVELYLSYMKLALGGMVLSAAFLIASAALRTNNILIGILVLGFSLAVITPLVFIWSRSIYLKKELEKTDLIRREKERIESEQHTEEKARRAKFLVEKLKTIDFQQGVLVRQVTILINELQGLNFSKPMIDKAIEDFLTLQDDHSDTIPNLREKFVDSIKQRLGIEKEKKKEKKEEDDRKVAG